MSNSGRFGKHGRTMHFKYDPPPENAIPVASIRRAKGEPGPNDPCPCGNGKKYKRCHGKPS
jgi:uncharacterized protein YecA (UPF0149 family)